MAYIGTSDKQWRQTQPLNQTWTYFLAHLATGITRVKQRKTMKKRNGAMTIVIYLDLMSVFHWVGHPVTNRELVSVGNLQIYVRTWLGCGLAAVSPAFLLWAPIYYWSMEPGVLADWCLHCHNLARITLSPSPVRRNVPYVMPTIRVCVSSLK